MTAPLEPQTSYRTWRASWVGAAGTVLTAIGNALNAETGTFLQNFFSTTNIGLLVIGIGLLANGWVARDDKVSSEGHIALKDRPE